MRKIISSCRQKLWRTSFLLVATIICSFYGPVANAMKETTIPAKPKISEPVTLSEEQERELYLDIRDDDENKAIEKMKNIDPNYKFEKFIGLEGWPIINLVIRNNKIKLLEELIKRGVDTNLIDIGELKQIENKESEVYKSLIKKIQENKFKTMKEGYTTLYKDGSMAKTLDLCILFDLPRQEEDDITTSTDPNCTMTDELCQAIDDEEAIIVSQSLMSSLSLLSKQTKLKYYGGKDYKTIVDKLLCNNNWSIFVNTNNDLFVLIPHSKYPLIKKLADLKIIGLNPGMLTQKLNYTETISSENSQKIFDKLIGKKSIDKDGTSKFFDLPFRLKTMFLVAPTMPEIKNIRTLDVRIIMSGHGSEGTSIYKKDWIAGFSLADTRSLRDVFENIGCSFVIIGTCFGGETMFMTQTLNFQRTQPEPLPSPISSKNFIEVVLGIPGSSISGSFDKPSQAFSDLNKFFEDQKKSVIEKIKLKEKLNEEEEKYLSKNITEQQILAGGEFELPRSQKKTIHFSFSSLITRDKNIKKSTDFIKILQKLIYKKANNIPRVRFPGDREMAPLIEVFPGLIQEAKELLNKILEEKKKDLKKDENMLPGFISKRHAGTDLLKQTINRLKIEIYDIGEYLKQLDRK